MINEILLLQIGSIINACKLRISEDTTQIGFNNAKS